MYEVKKPRGKNSRRKKVADVIGMKQGRLLIVSAVEPQGIHATHFMCKCDCGNKKIVSWGSISKGTLSCGCIGIEKSKSCPRIKHGMSRTKIYSTWISMIHRCQKDSPNADGYHDRGIKVCERWLSLYNFIEDMGDPPGRGYSIDRTDNDGNYEPGNCRWATVKQQCGNRRSTVLVVLNGVSMIASDAAGILGLSHHTIIDRHRRGVEIDSPKHVPTGVSFHKPLKKWRAQGTLNGKKVHLGYYDSREEAMVGREKKLKELQ